MLRTIAWILGVILIVGGCWWLWTHANGKEVPTNGDVVLKAPPADSKDTTASTDATAAADTAGNPGRDATVPAPAPSAQAAPAAVANTPAAQTPSPQSATIVKPAAALPVSDTIAPNPPNGMAFTGSGKFQWYRQGNLTWRVNTENGTSCIAFATDEEWRKPIVYRHGCGNA